MKKIPCLILKNHENQSLILKNHENQSLILKNHENQNDPPANQDIDLIKINPECKWVMKGEGKIYRKFDGTACAIIENKLYTRFDAKLNKKGQRKAIPDEAIPCEEAPDPVTGHWPHWRPVKLPEDQYVIEAFEAEDTRTNVEYGFTTFEACGPKINGNHEKLNVHVMFPHKLVSIDPKVFMINPDIEYPRTRSLMYIYEALASRPYEGFVFHHEDGRMAKIRRVDFGLAWPIKD